MPDRLQPHFHVANPFAQAYCRPGSAEPFLKWPGGKQWLASRLAGVAASAGRYFEPFLGAGAVFFAAVPRVSHLSDTNAALIDTYSAVRDQPASIIRALSRWSYDEATYYRVRSARLRTRAGRAAQFIFLNRTCWNGLYRVNQKGEFNVPLGTFRQDPLRNLPGLLRSASLSLQHANLAALDFEAAAARAREGDLVYFDPPYTVRHDNNGFIRYNERLFSWQDQVRLAACARRLMRRGVDVVVSNAAHREIRALYAHFHVTSIERRTALAADANARGLARELLFTSFSSQSLD